MLSNFVQWGRQHRQVWRMCEELNVVLTSFFSHHYLLRAAYNFKSQMRAAIMRVTLPLFRRTASVPLRASRALDAQRCRVAGWTRPPLPGPAVYATAGWLSGH